MANVFESSYVDTMGSVSSSNPFQSYSGLETTNSINSVSSVGGNIIDMISSVAFIAIGLGLILTIVLLIKTILDKKRIKNGVTIDTIKPANTTSIILLVLNVLSMNIVGIILSIISLVLVGDAKKALDANIEVATSKIKTATTINIVIVALTLIGLVLSMGSVAILNVVSEFAMY